MSGSSSSGREDRPAGRKAALAGWKGAVAATAFGLLLLGLLEAVLGLAGVSPVTHEEDPFVGFAGNSPLFVRPADDPTAVYLETAPNKRRFFNLQRFTPEKPAGAYRIFCLGGSTTYGRPYDDRTSFAGWLRELLPEADPGRQWEVVNAGGISYASYRVVRLMRELTGYQPDLFIIYTGHNEFLEERTYGELRDLPAPVRGAAGLLSRTRTWAALGALLGAGEAARQGSERALLPGEVDTRLEHSAGPERYERDDPLAEQVLAHYRFNLERMIATARDAGAAVVLVSPASNLADCSPFKSQHSPGLDEAGAARVTARLAAARDRLRDGLPTEALALLDEALELDPRHAELHFRRGEALVAVSRHSEALAAFTRARDEDVCPLRALSSVRQAAHEVARDTGTPLIDYRRLLEEAATVEEGRSLPGSDYFLDHVHPTIEGHRLLAREIMRLLTDQGVLRPGPRWGEEAVAAVTRRVEAGIDPRRQARALANLAVVLSWAGKQEDARRLGLEALASGAADPTTTILVAQTLARQEARAGRAEEALAYYRRALRANPMNPETHLQMGLLMVSLRRLEAAAAHLFLASVIWPENAECHRQLGFLMAARGRYDVAFWSLREADRLDPGRPATEQKLDWLRDRVHDEARLREPPKLSLDSYPSGWPRRLTQARAQAAGYLPDGIWTEWHETGDLRRFADYRGGQPDGVDARWDEAGRRVARAVTPGPS